MENQLFELTSPSPIKLGQAIQIQSLTNSSGLLTVYVQNVGDTYVDLTAHSVYVNNALVGVTGGTGADRFPVLL